MLSALRTGRRIRQDKWVVYTATSVFRELKRQVLHLLKILKRHPILKTQFSYMLHGAQNKYMWYMVLKINICGIWCSE